MNSPSSPFTITIPPLNLPLNVNPSPDAEYHKLESKVETGKARKRARIVLSKDEEDDSSKQGRIDEDLNTYFAQDDEVVHDQDTAKEG
ncbi:hypothetical protein Tco_1285617 [Tanacetum coccineum]